MRYLICYDIPNNRRRRLMAVCLDGYGGRTQKSVFEAVLDQALFAKMVQDVQNLLKENRDSVHIYPLCATCDNKVLRLGIPHPIPGMEQVYVV